MRLCVLLLILFLCPASIYATQIDGTLKNLGGNRWQANYTITNNTLGSPIEEVTIWFDLSLYDNLSVVSTASTWNAIAIDPDPFIPDNGFYDVLALSWGIDPGASLGGFVVAFDWLGTAASPSSQLFEVVNPSNFSVIESGQTVLVLDQDGDGVANDNDICPDSNLTATVVIESCDSGVTNHVSDNGCSISDELLSCEDESNHGQYVSCVSSITNRLKQENIITGADKGNIQSCAAQADVP